MESQAYADANYIRQIIDGVEFVVAETKPLAHEPLKLDGIEFFLNNQFREICEVNDITLTLNVGEMLGVRHRESLFLVLKNLVRNAIEASAKEESQREVLVDVFDNVLRVKNYSSSTVVDRAFRKLKGDTHHNLGLGLHFVDAVAKAHGATLESFRQDGYQVYQVILPL